MSEDRPGITIREATPDNPAGLFYESMGGARIRAEETEHRGHSLKKVAYGWTEIEALVERVRA